ncbi:sugar phosphate isomerase/epimerase family protein [Verrucomicrobiales bacterium BCK34]|nr:sugar phosphate isomerase/epimerase family protein [Verrucomicrobiales bacterium BCK34]
MMKYAICNETFQDWPFEKAFQYAREVGYTGIEIAPFTMASDARDVSAEQRATVKQQIKDAGLECVGLHWLLAKTEGYYLTTPDEAVRKSTGEYLAELARLCRDLDGSIMVLGSPQQRNLLPGISHEQGMAFAAEAIRSAMPVLEDCGVTLALEPLGPGEGDFLNTAASGIELAKMVDSPNCRLHLDVKAMSSEEKPFAQIIRESKDWVAHFHANDANLLGPGMGDIEFDPIFAALKEIDYQDWVSVEVFDYKPGIEHICESSFSYMREIEGRV